MTPEEELTGQINWLQSLADALEDGEIEDARQAVEAALKLLRRKLNE